MQKATVSRFEVFTAVKIQVEVVKCCDAVWCCGRIPTFQRSVLSYIRIHPEDGGSMNL
jgi:hypothetical protein